MSETKRIQTNVIIAENEGLFFKEVEFDFDSIPAEFWKLRNQGARIFMVNNIDEKIEVKAYPTRDRAVMFNAWITKNISYKVVAQSLKCCLDSGLGDNNNNNEGGFFPQYPDYSRNIVGTHDDLLNPEPIYNKEEKEIMVPDPFSISGYRIIKTSQLSEFDPPLYQYPKLREKMCIKIRLKVVRTEHLEIETVHHI